MGACEAERIKRRRLRPARMPAASGRRPRCAGATDRRLLCRGGCARPAGSSGALAGLRRRSSPLGAGRQGGWLLALRVVYIPMFRRRKLHSHVRCNHAYALVSAFGAVQDCNFVACKQNKIKYRSMPTGEGFCTPILIEQAAKIKAK